jgi:hypothetical protein
MMHTTKFISEKYDELYDKADKLLKEYNPCRIKCGSCQANRIDPKYNSTKQLCCGGCPYWKNGCTVKSLACKLWLCGPVQGKFPYPNNKKTELVSELVGKLEDIRNEAYKAGIPLLFRGSKEENMKMLSRS